jgi:signal transduction histidine kinase
VLPLTHTCNFPETRLTGSVLGTFMSTDYLSQAKFLIVDDEPANVRLLERILNLSGCDRIQCITDSREALPAFLEFEPDIVLLDLNMPYLNGFAILDQIKAAIGEDEYLPILMLTADVTAETRRRSLAGGAKDFLTKPLDQSEVILRIRNLLENRFLRLELQRQNHLLEEQVRERAMQLEATVHELQSTQEHVVKQERLRALGMMAGGIAHDFNNSLTMILGYGELLLPWLTQHATPRELTYLEHMVSAARDASQVVSRLRDFYRPIENNEIRVPVDLNSVAEQVISLTSPKWKGRSLADGVQIEVLADLRHISPVAANGAELREVLTNLIFNAVDAMPCGGTITVATRESDHGVLISVADTGTGMTEKEKEQCLEPFFTTKGEQGTGLGLSVVYGIIQRHGGKIAIDSAKGVGTTFAILFPATVAQKSTAIPQVARVDRSLRVLVVDDQEIICELIAEYLHGDAHTTASAFRGDEALALFRTDSFDLVITDQSMPVMNGVQLATAIKTIAPETPVILLTGFGEELLDQNLPPGVDLVVGKPVSHADLRKAIFQALSHRPALASVA